MILMFSQGSAESSKTHGVPEKQGVKAMTHLIARFWRTLVVCLCLFTFLSAGVVSAQEGSETVDMEFVPIYQLGQEEAILQLYQNLELIGITRDQIMITTLPSVSDRIVIQGPADLIDIAKEILRTIDPPPAQPAAPPAELIDEITVHNLSPSQFAEKLDEIMNNFIGMVKLDPSSDNFIVYARNSDGAGQITFYIPNLEVAVESFDVQPLGFTGYKIFLRATSNEQELINSVKNLLSTIDVPVEARGFKILNVYYLEIAEALLSLGAAGYITDSDPATVLQSGAGPIIYTAPQVISTSTELSTRFEGGGSGGIRGNQFSVVEFNNPVATTDVNKLIVFGTPAEIASVEQFLSLIDRPARQVMIEAQIIEINVDDLFDLGLRQVEGVDDILSGSVNPVFPGESGSSVSGNFFTYDDESKPAGSFQAGLAALILDGRATIKARPKVVTVDGRQAIITIGRQVPVVQETTSGTDRSSFDISFVPVGITLNIKTRIGYGGEEVSMQVNAVVSNVETLNNVVSELSLMAPELNTREVSTLVRIPNHQSLILGGLISTETETRTYKIPILGDLPLIGAAFRRTREIQDRTEIIIVITPHIAEEATPREDDGIENPYEIIDPYLIPLGSQLLDNLDNIIFPGEYVLKAPDIRGIDITTGEPTIPIELVVPNSANDPVMLTLLQVIRKLRLVDNLRMMAGIEIPEDMDVETARFHAEAFLLAYLRYLNDLEVEDMIAGRRLLVPAFPIPDEGFEEPELIWHTINYLAATRDNPLLNGLAETIKYVGEQPVFDPIELFAEPEESDLPLSGTDTTSDESESTETDEDSDSDDEETESNDEGDDTVEPDTEPETNADIFDPIPGPLA